MAWLQLNGAQSFGGLNVKKHFARYGIVLMLALGGCGGGGVEAGNDPMPGDLAEDGMPETSPSPEMGPHGLVPAEVGESIETRNLQTYEPDARLLVTGIQQITECNGPTFDPNDLEPGRLLIGVSVEIEFLATFSPSFSVTTGTWSVIGADNTLYSADTNAAYSAFICLDPTFTLSSALPGTRITGTVVIETAQLSGWITLRPQIGPADLPGYEWPYQVG